MIYIVETYDNLKFEITPGQYDAVVKVIDTNKFIAINGHTVAVASIKGIYPDYFIDKDADRQPASDVAGYITSGHIPNSISPKLFELAKKVWKDHEARQPEIDKQIAPARRQAHESWVRMAQLLPEDPRRSYAPGL